MEVNNLSIEAEYGLDEHSVPELILYANLNLEKQGIYTRSCGVDFPRTRFYGQLFSHEDSPAMTYLRNFENSYKLGPILGTGEFMQNTSNMAMLLESQMREDIEDAIKLPPARKLKVSLIEALNERHSSRSFSSKNMSLQDLSDILFYSAGVHKTSQEHVYGKKILRHWKPYPSGGGMYSIRLMLAIYTVADMTSAIYEYYPVSHSLKVVAPITNIDNLIVSKRYEQNSGEYEQIDDLNPSVVLLCVNHFDVPMLKYGELALALAFLFVIFSKNIFGVFSFLIREFFPDHVLFYDFVFKFPIPYLADYFLKSFILCFLFFTELSFVFMEYDFLVLLFLVLFSAVIEWGDKIFYQRKNYSLFVFNLIRNVFFMYIIWGTYSVLSFVITFLLYPLTDWYTIRFQTKEIRKKWGYGYD